MRAKPKKFAGAIGKQGFLLLLKLLELAEHEPRFASNHLACTRGELKLKKKKCQHIIT